MGDDVTILFGGDCHFADKPVNLDPCCASASVRQGPPGRDDHSSAATITEQNEPIIDSINPLTWLRAAFSLWHGGYDLVVVQWWK
jgi:hypothetical protein